MNAKPIGMSRTRIGRMQVTFVGNYLPRNCGIATFTYDLSHAVGKEIGEDAYTVIAMNNIPQGYKYPQEVVFELQQNRVQDYRLAAEYINLSGTDIVCLQHEFGIFGGPGGIYITNLLTHLDKPVVTTLHTVIRDPEPKYKKALIDVTRLSRALVVMSKEAKHILTEDYDIPASKIHHIPHGVPDIPFIDPNFYKDLFKVEDRFTILTFGLLSPEKGIEVVLDALPAVVAKHPKVVYIVLGATHPEIKRHQGEEYRISLERKVRDLGLTQNVIFHNKFVDIKRLCEFIGMADVVVVPNLSGKQIVSGTLSYALGMGKAIISTPYSYAREMLADGRGILVDFGDSKGLAMALIELIENDRLRHKMRKNAYNLGRRMIWQEVGRAYVALFNEVLSDEERAATPRYWKPKAPATLPEVRLDHLKMLTDDTGIIQHATHGVPDRRYGYSTDDASRALVVVLTHYSLFKEESSLLLAKKYLSFLHYAQREDGRFHNFMDYQRKFTDKVGSEDTLGRALWGLGVVVNLNPTDSHLALAREMFEKSTPAVEKLVHPRAMAYALIGLYEFLQRYPGASNMRRLVNLLADRLLARYRKYSSPDWRWFDDALTYGNANIPRALLLAYQITGKKEYLEVGLESLDFLTEIEYHDGYFDIVGNKGWYNRNNKEKALYGQQPIDIGYLVEAYLLAHTVTGKTRYRELANVAFEWFLGRNRPGVPLYDFATGACADGIESNGASLNQGAESVICFLMALLALIKAESAKSEADAEAAAAAGYNSAEVI